MADPDVQNVAPSASHTDYGSCDITDLQNLVELRTGKEVAQPMSKRDLVERLEEDDRKAGGSRFLNLAPEMRNRIYRELLILEPVQHPYRVMDVVDPYDPLGDFRSYDEHTGMKRLACHAAILRVNGQIYREAKSILYKENEAKVEIQARIAGDGRLDRQLRVAVDSAGLLYLMHLDVSALQHTPRTWSTHLRELPNVSITVKVDFEDAVHNKPCTQPDSLAISVNNMLYSFASFLSSANAMPRAKIKVSIEGMKNLKPSTSFDEVLLRKMLWPLSYFSDIETFDISIDSSDHPRVLQPPKWTRNEACKGFLYKCVDALHKLRRTKDLFDEQEDPEPLIDIDVGDNGPGELLNSEKFIGPVGEEYLQRAIAETGQTLKSMVCWRLGRTSAFRHLGVPSTSDDAEKWQLIMDAAEDIRDWDEEVLAKKANNWVN